jgi:hypothetical protein
MTCELADESLEAGKFLDPEAAGEGGQGRQHLRNSVVFQSVNQIRRKLFIIFSILLVGIEPEFYHFKGAQESILRSQIRQAVRPGGASTTTLFLLGS